MTMRAPFWALKKAWARYPGWQEDHERLQTAAGAHALPDWVDERTVRDSPDRALIEKLVYEHNTRLREYLDAVVEREALRIFYLAQLAEQERAAEAANEQAWSIARRVYALKRDGRKTVRIDDLLEAENDIKD